MEISGVSISPSQFLSDIRDLENAKCKENVACINIL